MRAAILAAAVLLGAAPLVPAQAQAPANAYGYSADDLSGAWQGAYQGGAEVTPFTANVVMAGGRVFGAITEPNTFGQPPALFLLSDFSGTVSGGRIVFEKTYNGVGGQTHTVVYSGRISPDGRRITGTWTLESTTGRFEMVR